MKKLLTSVVLTMVLTFGATFAHAGIIILADSGDGNDSADVNLVDTGIIILKALDGIIIL